VVLLKQVFKPVKRSQESPSSGGARKARGSARTRPQARLHPPAASVPYAPDQAPVRRQAVLKERLVRSTDSGAAPCTATPSIESRTVSGALQPGHAPEARRARAWFAPPPR